MEIRYVRPDDSLLAISNIYERSWKYAYQNIIPQDYLDSIPTGRWANSITKNGMKSLVLLENGRIIGTAAICKSRWDQMGKLQRLRRDCFHILSAGVYRQGIRDIPFEKMRR